MSYESPAPDLLPYGGRNSRLRESAERVLQTRSFWALADQGIASASNFLTGIMLVRSLPPASYGGYSIIWEMLIFLNSLHAALVVYPLMVRGTKVDLDVLRRLSSMGLIFTLLLGILLSPTMFAFAAWQGLWIGVFAATAILAFQIHETLRRTLMSHFLYTWLIWGDVIGYLGMAGIVVSLAQVDLLSVPTAFAAMTLSFSLAAVVQWWKVQPIRDAQSLLRPTVEEFWILGRWMVASNLTLVLTTLGVQWCLALFRDLTEVAKLGAVIFMIKLTNPLLAAMSGLIVPAVAREGHARAGLKYALLGIAILSPYFLLLCIAPDFSIGLFYGKNSREYAGIAFEVRIAVFTCILTYAGAMALATLMGLGRTRANFLAQVVNSIASVAIVIPATIRWGWTGAIVGGLIASTLTTAMAGVLLLRAIPHHPPRHV